MSKCNILLVVLDSVRAKNCSLYGHENETTPFLTTLASDAALFEHARAPSIHSISSHASIFSGYHTEQHNVTEHKSFLEPDATIWNYLKTRYGYNTGLFTPNVIVSQTSNLSEPFDKCVGPKRAKFRLFDGGLSPLDIEGNQSPSDYLRAAINHEAPIRSVLNGVYKKLESRGGSQDPESEHANVYIDEFLAWIDNLAKPWAACINFMDAHTPYIPTQEHDRWSGERAHKIRDALESGNVPELSAEYWNQLGLLEPLYDGTIRQVDAAVERLVTALDTRGVLDETLLVVTSDHGEGLGERSELDGSVRLRHHSWGISEELLHVPLVMKVPDFNRSRRISDPVSLTQFPSVVRAALEGNDSVDAFIPESDVVSSTYRIQPPGNELAIPRSEREKYFGPWRAIYRPSDDGVRKYMKRSDDSATLNVQNAQTVTKRSDSDDGIVEEMFSSFKDAGVKVGSSDDRDVDSSVEERLTELGYLQ
jgi:arylsulfatase A-like enzyme